MEELSFTEPGHPVYKSYIVPRTLDGQPRYVRRLTEKDVNDWRRILEKLRTFLTDVIDYLQRNGYVLNSHERIELVGDCICLFFKIPLLREVLPSVAPNPIKAYLMRRLHWKNSPKILSEGLLEFTEESYGRLLEGFSRERVAAVFSDPAFIDLVENAWLNIPADTRPGANTSGLISHMLLTSAIAWALAIEDGLSRLEAAEVRLSAIMHDVGKPFNYREHHRISPQIASCLLSGIIEVNELNELLEKIAAHHLRDSHLRRADVIASNIDRLGPYVAKTIERKMSELTTRLGLDPNLAWSSGEEAWKFWADLERAKPGIIEELSREFAETLHQGGASMDIMGVSERELSLFLFDVGGIQEFIMRSSELRCVIASSLVVDVATTAFIPLMLQMMVEEEFNQWVPVESIIYSSGGVVLLLLPSCLRGVMETVFTKVREQFERERMTVYMASTELNTSYYVTSGKLASNMLLRKLDDESRYQPIRLNAYALCEFCRMENHMMKIGTGERVCDTCGSLYEIGNELSFNSRWTAELSFMGDRFSPQQAFDNFDWRDISKGIIELLAGHSVKDLKRLGLLAKEGSETSDELQPRLRNVSLIKMDGNLMGAFFADSISITDSLERSARVDIALKRALSEAVHTMGKAIQDSLEAKRLAALFSLGLIYVGGDDAMILCPSWAAVPLAHQIGRAFYREMGEAASLSMGVLATPPKHDIWASIDAASQLLKIAKRVGRKHRGGAICYDVVEGGSLSGFSIVERHESLRTRKLTSQPLLISQSPTYEGFSIDELLQMLCEHTGRKEAADIFTLAYQASQESMKKDSSELKKLRSAIRKVIQVGESQRVGGSWTPVSFIYTMKMSRGDGHHEYKLVEALISRWLEITSRGDQCLTGVPLADVDLLIKFLGGGVL